MKTNEILSTDIPVCCKEMEALCLEAFDNGECTTLREAIDELKARIEE